MCDRASRSIWASAVSPAFSPAPCWPSSWRERGAHGAFSAATMNAEKLALHGGSPVRPTLLPYARQTIEPDDLAAVNAALTADWITQGPLVARFERALAERAGV